MNIVLLISSYLSIGVALAAFSFTVFTDEELISQYQSNHLKYPDLVPSYWTLSDDDRRKALNSVLIGGSIGMIFGWCLFLVWKVFDGRDS